MSESAVIITLAGGATVTLPTGTAPNAVREYVVALTGGPLMETSRSNADSPYMTTDEAARYLRVRKKRIYNLTSRGEIPHRKQDGRLIFRRDELDRWANEFYVGPDWAGPGCSEDL